MVRTVGFDDIETDGSGQYMEIAGFARFSASLLF
jgi:hypothetical protein